MGGRSGISYSIPSKLHNFKVLQIGQFLNGHVKSFGLGAEKRICWKVFSVLGKNSIIKQVSAPALTKKEWLKMTIPLKEWGDAFCLFVTQGILPSSRISQMSHLHISSFLFPCVDFLVFLLSVKSYNPAALGQCSDTLEVLVPSIKDP